MTFYLKFGVLPLSLCAATFAFAQESTTPLCEAKGENGMVTLLLCPEGLEQEVLAAEGKMACNERKPCGAWIWTDPEMVPAEAPDSHDKLTQPQVTSAIAIWVNEKDQLISLEKVE